MEQLNSTLQVGAWHLEVHFVQLTCLLKGEAEEGGEGRCGEGGGEEGDGQGAQVVGRLLLAAAGREGHIQGQRRPRQQGQQKGQEEESGEIRSQFQVVIAFRRFIHRCK